MLLFSPVWLGLVWFLVVFLLLFCPFFSPCAPCVRVAHRAQMRNCIGNLQLLQLFSKICISWHKGQN